jgi:hypothetical protein
LLLSFSVYVIIPQLAFSAQPIIIDHTCTDISQIPAAIGPMNGVLQTWVRT